MEENIVWYIFILRHSISKGKYMWISYQMGLYRDPNTAPPLEADTRLSAPMRICIPNTAFRSVRSILKYYMNLRVLGILKVVTLQYIQKKVIFDNERI